MLSFIMLSDIAVSVIMLNVFMVSVIMLRVIMPHDITLKAIMLSVLMPSVIMLNVIILSITMPSITYEGTAWVTWFNVFQQLITVQDCSKGFHSIITFNAIMLSEVITSVIAECHNPAYHNAECHNAEWPYNVHHNSVILPSVIMLSDFALTV